MTAAAAEGRCVGRDRELVRIEELLDEAIAGHGRIVLVGGEPGIGKSRLLHEVERLADAREVPVARGQAVEAEGAPAFWPWRQVLDEMERAPGATAAESTEWTALRDFVHASPSEAAERVSGPPAAARDRFQRFEAVAALIAAVAAPDGLVILLDDLHWADTSSLRLLEHLARAWAGTRALLVAAYRPGPRDRDASVRHTLAELARNDATARIELAGLPVEASELHLEQLSGSHLDRRTVIELHRRTNGNPFFLREFGRLLAEHDNASAEALDVIRAIPPSIADVIARRASGLSPGCQQALEAGSVLGHEPAPELIASALSVPVAQVMALLGEAADAGFLTPSPTTGGFEFTHALVREVLYSELSPARRVALHERVAAELERREQAAPSLQLSQLAHHWLNAANAGHAEQAASRAEQAADQAMRQLAYEEAARLYEAAHGVASPRHAGRLLVGAARARFLSGELERACDLCRGAAAVARATGDAGVLADAALVVTGVGDIPVSTMISELCDEALALQPDSAVNTRSRLLAQLTMAKLYLGEYDVLEPLSRQALAGAELSGDRDTLAAALRARHIASSHPSGVDERLEMAGRLLQLGTGPVDEMWARSWRFDAYLQHGDLQAAQGEVAAVDTLVERSQQPLARWHLANMRFALAHARGAFADARTAAHESNVVGRSAGQLARTRALSMSILVAEMTGEDCTEDERAQAEIAHTSTHRQDTMRLMARLMLARLAIAQGRLDDARRWYEDPPPVRTWRLMPPVVLVALSGRAMALHAFGGERDECRAVYRELRPFADHFATSGAGTIACMGSVELYLGLLASTMGQVETAVQHLKRAVQRNDAAGMQAWAVASRYELAAALRDRGGAADVARALQVVAEAEAGAKRLGMHPLAVRAATLRERMIAGTRQARILTPREEEIAAMVAQGLTSREIADAMHISARTADNHVQHILDKLDLRSRTQIAAWVARRRTGA